MSDEKKEQHRFIQYLFSLSPEKDTGILADLRKGYSKATAIRAWPHIGRFCHLANDHERLIFQTVAAAYATWPEHNDDSERFANLGTVVKKLVDKDEKKRPTFDTVFRRLLACNSAEDVCPRIKGIIITAKNDNVIIPWEQLFWDLIKWGDTVKVKWAAQYWAIPDHVADFEDSDDTDDSEDTDDTNDSENEEG